MAVEADLRIFSLVFFYLKHEKIFFIVYFDGVHLKEYPTRLIVLIVLLKFYIICTNHVLVLYSQHITTINAKKKARRS
jgi:hypothetical protein